MISDGEVTKNGSFAKENGYKVISVNDNGDKRQVLIIRNNNDKINTYRVNLTDKNLISSNLYNINPNDIIYIQPVRAKSLRIINAPTIQIMLQTLTTFVLVMSFVLNKF